VTVLQCANCGEEIEGEPVKRGTRLFCSAACAFESARSVDCSGRTDVSQTTTPAEEISRLLRSNVNLMSMISNDSGCQ